MSQPTPERTYFQDGLHGNHCYGCGAWNEKGLRIKSYWDGDEAVCVFEPEPHHAAMPPDVMNGGTIASVIDCHGVCSAIADAYKTEGREVGEGEKIKESHQYFDMLSLLTQIGAIPGQSAEAAGA